MIRSYLSRMPSRCEKLILALGLLAAGCHTAPLRTEPSPVPAESVVSLTPERSVLNRYYAETVRPVNLPSIPLPEIVVTPESNEFWPLTLREAVNIALRNSQVIRTLQGDQVTSTGVTNYDPAIYQATRDAAVAAFDASVNLNYTADRFNQPPATVFGPGIPANTRRDDATLSASLVKPWATGATTSVAYNPNPGYLFFPNGTSGLYNPKYASNTELYIKQPLLRGAGIDVNRAPIRIAQLQADQSIWDVKQATLSLVRSVEESYWSLQASRTALQAIEDILPLLDSIVRIQQERFEEERTIRAEVAKARTQQAAFRQAAIDARSNALNQELHLRNLLGLPPNDGLTIDPTDRASESPLKFDPVQIIQTAADNRPELMRQRLGIRIGEMNLIVAENGFKPQLDLQGLYRTNGLSDNVGDSLDMMFQNKFTDWTAGASFSMPIGRRAARANLHAAELELTRERIILRQKMHATAHRLSDVLRQLESVRYQYDEAKVRVEESAIWMEGSRGRYEEPPPSSDGGDWLLAALNDYLLSLRSQADSITSRAQLLAQYNTLLATLQEVQGTLLANYDIQLEGDPITQARNSRWLPESERVIDPEIWNLDAGTPGSPFAAPATPPPPTVPASRPLPGRYGF
ncbi:MAG: TolC family protein [Planctomycetaceae bacterium]|nr:TolC family protein [Planctomycetaceae bacterium]